MRKYLSVLFGLFAVAAVAAPTANEDYVDRQDGQTYTNAVNAAKAYADGVSSQAVVTAKSDAASKYVPTTRKVNGQPLTNDVEIAVGVTSVNGATGDVTVSVPVTSVNSKTGDVTITAADVGAVPTTRKVNGQPLTNDITIASGVTSVNGETGDVTVSVPVTSVNAKTGDVTITAADVGAVPTTRKVNGQPLTNDITIAAGVTSVNSKTGVVSLNASDVGAYGATAGSTLAAQVATIGAHLNAEDARFVVTNYNSVTHTPEAYVEIKLPDQSWSLIWSEMTRWNYLFNNYLPTNYYTKGQVDTALSQKADRAWGAYDSETGAYAPDDYTWISSKKIAIAANLAYQRTITTEGAIWVLESNGTVTETGGLTNGFFRISDDEGNALFEIVKGSKRTVGADPSSCQVVGAFTPTKLQIGYSVVSDVHPTLYVCNSLSTQLWKAETDADCLANVVWSGSSGAWVAQVQGKTAQTALFVKATYEVGGETYISNTAPVSMQYLMLNGVKYAVGTATISGNTVLTLTVAP